MPSASVTATALDFSQPVGRWAVEWGVPGLEARLHISFSTRLRRSLGRCEPERKAIRLADWLRAAPAGLLDEVLCHEAAHVAVHELHGRGCRPHGSEWKALMNTAGFEARVQIPADMLPRDYRPRAKPALLWEHQCPVCHARRVARRRMTRWRCAACRAAGLEGKLVIASQPQLIRVDS